MDSTGLLKGEVKHYQTNLQLPAFFPSQRLIPVDASNDLFLYKAPEVVRSTCYVIRPYCAGDRQALYALVLRTCEDLQDGGPLYQMQPSLPADV